MSFELPNLDEKDYNFLKQHLINSIPHYTSLWTDFNETDPGITLIELLAWIGESLLYQANQIPLETYLNFLRLIAGVENSQTQTPFTLLANQNYDQIYLNLLAYLTNIENSDNFDAQDLKQVALTFLNASYSAVNEQDFISLAVAANILLKPDQPQIKKAYLKNFDDYLKLYILSNQIAQYNYPPYPNNLYSANSNKQRVTVVLIQSNEQLIYQTLLNAVTTYIFPRLLLGTIVNIEPADFTYINLQIQISCNSYVQLSVILSELTQILMNYFDPIIGELDGNGWSYDQLPLINEIKTIIDKLPGVESLNKLNLNLAPTIVLGSLSTLSVNTLLADIPAGIAEADFVGLPRLRILDICANKAD